ncbi:Lacal_2735 family protein [Aequorivita sp. CIP111184]|uniref:Lacal_2735 family protein n=1 Tax=Aequorivita sp. CIP111184 TaxID=2211356 RepID=UPI000DBBBA07|nr:Lacal_2735 family protein [Aequorivita sp. CIP111184]SRX53999.1 hypothetical protein AEQU1_01050 [Aequorivita sp. CIP111184]
MLSWFRKKSKVEVLKERYTLLMKKSYETALKDITKSEKVHHQADKLFREIKYLTFQHGDK